MISWQDTLYYDSLANNLHIEDLNFFNSRLHTKKISDIIGILDGTFQIDMPTDEEDEWTLGIRLCSATHGIDYSSSLLGVTHK